MIIQVGSARLHVDDSKMEKYLTGLYDAPAKLVAFRKLGEGFHNAGFLLRFMAGEEEKRLVWRH